MKNINEEKKQQMKKWAKRGMSVSLCAVLAGGLMMGSGNIFKEAAPKQIFAAEDGELTFTKAEKQSDSKAKGSLDVSDIVENAMPSVVSIVTKSVQEVQDYFGMFGYGGYAPEQREVQGSGSGIILGKKDGNLLLGTNYHVVKDAETVSVGFVDNEVYEASVKGYDETKDLAIVAVPLDDISDDTLNAISVAVVGSSDDLKVGEQVVAIGNALGYGQSVTTGIVSAKNRRMNGDYIQGENTTGGTNLIQTDAAINPGNSGGALLNMDGEVVGINSAKLASTEVEGIGYAIAISDVSNILEDMMTRDKLDDSEHGVLGITGTTVSQEAIDLYGIPEGVFVKEVMKNGAAEKAEIPANAIITEFDGKSVTSIESLVSFLQYYKPGEKVDVVFQVRDGDSYKEKTVTVKLDENTNAQAASDKQNNDTNQSNSTDEGSSNDNNNDNNNDNSRNSILDGLRDFADWQ